MTAEKILKLAPVLALFLVSLAASRRLDALTRGMTAEKRGELEAGLLSSRVFGYLALVVAVLLVVFSDSVAWLAHLSLAWLLAWLVGGHVWSRGRLRDLKADSEFSKAFLLHRSMLALALIVFVAQDLIAF